MAMIFGFLLVGSIWGYFFTAGIFIIPLIGLLFGFIHLKTRTSKIIPYFDTQFPHTYSHLTHGSDLLKHVNLLDNYLNARNERELSSFGYSHKLRGELIKWHEPDDALKILKKLTDFPLTNFVNPDESKSLIADIEELHKVLEAAKASGSKFTLLIRLDTSVSGYEIEKGEGYF